MSDLDDLFDKNRVKQKTYYELTQDAEALDNGAAPSLIEEILHETIRARLSMMEEKSIIRAIKKATGVPLCELKEVFASIKNGGKKSVEDAGKDLANAALSKFFNGGDHLMRISSIYWAWTGTHWCRRSDEQIDNLIYRTLLDDPNPPEMNHASLLTQAAKIMRALRTVHEDPFNFTRQPLPIIPVQNGELWLDGKGKATLKPHNPQSYQMCCLDVHYDPSAKCPLYDQALLDVFQPAAGPSAMVEHWNEFVGYVIQPERDIASWWMLAGKGSNGKTRLMETVQKLMGGTAIAVMAIGDLNGDKHATSNLVGKLLLLDDDVDKNTKLPDGKLKQVSEAKMMSAQFKHKDAFNFLCRSLPVMLCNGYPYTSDISHGMRRRAQIIPFKRQFSDADGDPNLYKTIWATELPGVLNRALEGLVRLRQRGKFSPPQDCATALSSWLQSASTVLAFKAECLQPAPPQARARVPFKQVWEAYNSWNHAAGYKGCGRNLFRRDLADAGIKFIMNDGYLMVCDYRLDIIGKDVGIE